MYGHTDWRSAIAVTCSLAVVLAVVVWNLRKSSPSSTKCKEKKPVHTKETDNCQTSVSEEVVEKPRNDTIPDLPEPKWVKVGHVKDLYFYPLKSGRGKEISECNFTEFGMSVQEPGRLPLLDRMFLVYNEENGRFQTGRNYPTMILVSLSAVDEFKVKLEAVGMPSVVFSVPDSSKKNSKTIECKLWWGELVKCIDCGPEPAEWLSRFLTGTSSGLRLGYAVVEKRNLVGSMWGKYTKVYDTLRCEDLGLFSDLTSYMLMTLQSMEDLNEKLETPIPAIQFRPNILVDSHNPFAEDKWEWIKIGEHAVIRNVKPCNRCKMTRINPESGVTHKEEPLKTLKTYREQTDPERVAVDGTSPLMGIHCGLYIRGTVKVGDEVFVHVSDNVTETNHREDAQESQPT